MMYYTCNEFIKHNNNDVIFIGIKCYAIILFPNDQLLRNRLQLLLPPIIVVIGCNGHHANSGGNRH